jgi:4'-phosphopantetheinyl transferase
VTVEPLPEDEAHLWLVRLDEVEEERVAAYTRLLDETEAARLARFRVPALRRQHLDTRAHVRTTLSRHAAVSPAEWVFAANEHGCPRVDMPGLQWLRFNLSHTRGLVACLVARGRDVGVDVEHTTRNTNILGICDRYFAASEAAALRALPASEQEQRFFTYWTLKEAYIKARGMGLALPLGQFAFEVDRAPITVRFDPALRDDPDSWDFTAGAPTALHRMATAVRRDAGRPARVIVRWVVPEAD